jgi:hypothetical protein
MSSSNEAVAGTVAPTLPRAHAGPLVDLALIFLFGSLLVDGFPLGADALREFGARPTNLLLAMVWVFMLARRVMKRQAVGLDRHESYLMVAILVGAPLLNAPVAILQTTVDPRLALTDWTKQFGMLVWGLASFFIWKRIVTGMSPRRYCALIFASAAVPLIAFYLEYVDRSGTVLAALNIFRIGANDRPASFATEPAIYGAWIAFIWPLVFYYTKTGPALGRLAARILLLAAFASALLSNARTFVVVLVLQLVYLSYWAVQRQHGWGSRIRSLLLAGCITVAAVVVLAARLMTVFDLRGSESDVTRFGDTATGINVSLAHPLVGVGIGEFGNFFAQYAPAWAMTSTEVRKDVTGEGPYRASTFNMFVRLCVEFGIPLGIFFSALVLRPVFRAPKAALNRRFVLYAALSAVGGVGFWLSQDTYSYQPGILAMAVLAAALADLMPSSERSATATAKEVQ